jgi:redox-sensitive bicupin YhaK (pirin superfamily)
MEKKIIATFGGVQSQVGEFSVNRVLPNKFRRIVGPFFFLDHMLPLRFAAREAAGPDGDFAHPHRGIATYTYLLSGEMEHYDSRGNHGIVGAGGAQWMNAGNGIVHDENPSPAFQSKGGLLHGLQFWVNLPARKKAEAPEYLGVQNGDISRIALPNNAGFLKVLIGEYDAEKSPVPTYSQQFNYHVQLQPGASAVVKIADGFQSAVFAAAGKILVDGLEHQTSELLMLSDEGSQITLKNIGESLADIMIFGGEPYTEPIANHGPFVMNYEHEIPVAYSDFKSGKYGKIEYEKV